MDVEELSRTFALSAVIFRLMLVSLSLLFSYTPAEGQFLVIGQTQPIMAAPGDDVILPCHVEPHKNVAGMTVEWSKPDLQPDPNDPLSRVDYVHLYRNAREVMDMKMSAYLNRTLLFTDELKQGNISLKIINVTPEDNGRYKCVVPKLKSQRTFSIVTLVVEPNSVKTWTTETPLKPGRPQTPTPSDETDVKGGGTSRSRLMSVVVFFLFLIVGFGVSVCWRLNCKKATRASSRSRW